MGTHTTIVFMLWLMIALMSFITVMTHMSVSRQYPGAPTRARANMIGLIQIVQIIVLFDVIRILSSI